MSSWAEGNFADDDALDYVDALTGKMVGEIARSAGKKRLTGDEVLSKAMPRLAVLELLVTGVPTTAGLTVEQLAGWRAAFLAAFDGEAAVIYDDPADARKRRRVIEKTFAKLERAVAATGEPT